MLVSIKRRRRRVSFFSQFFPLWNRRFLDGTFVLAIASALAQDPVLRPLSQAAIASRTGASSMDAAGRIRLPLEVHCCHVSSGALVFYIPLQGQWRPSLHSGGPSATAAGPHGASCDASRRAFRPREDSGSCTAHGLVAEPEYRRRDLYSHVPDMPTH